MSRTYELDDTTPPIEADADIGDNDTRPYYTVYLPGVGVEVWSRSKADLVDWLRNGLRALEHVPATKTEEPQR